MPSIQRCLCGSRSATREGRRRRGHARDLDGLWISDQHRSRGDRRRRTIMPCEVAARQVGADGLELVPAGDEALKVVALAAVAVGRPERRTADRRAEQAARVGERPVVDLNPRSAGIKGAVQSVLTGNLRFCVLGVTQETTLPSLLQVGPSTVRTSELSCQQAKKWTHSQLDLSCPSLPLPWIRA
jgi:hypothetical protein